MVFPRRAEPDAGIFFRTWNGSLQIKIFWWVLGATYWRGDLCNLQVGKGKGIIGIAPPDTSEETVEEILQSLENHMAIQPLFIEYLLHKLEVRKMKGFSSEEIEVWQEMQQKFSTFFNLISCSWR